MLLLVLWQPERFQQTPRPWLREEVSTEYRWMDGLVWVVEVVVVVVMTVEVMARSLLTILTASSELLLTDWVTAPKWGLERWSAAHLGRTRNKPAEGAHATHTVISNYFDYNDILCTQAIRASDFIHSQELHFYILLFKKEEEEILLTSFRRADILHKPFCQIFYGASDWQYTQAGQMTEYIGRKFSSPHL